ncbi:hypothetical protein [Streptomyces puniciscabiei]|uniref:hypothetical protein n=1 Tax=Streptomyces puniciscabiei TaxID=164348 RepID=UPI0033282F84
MSKTRDRKGWACAGVLCAALVVTGCGSDQHGRAKSEQSSPAPTARPNATYSEPPPLPRGASGTPKAGLPTHVDDHDATAVGKAIAVTTWTFDTKIDNTPADAQRRTTGWLTADYAKTVSTAQPVAAPDASWTAMADHHGYTTVTVRQAHDTAPKDTPTEAYRQFEVTVTPHGRDGWKGPAETWVEWIHLVRSGTGDPWKADNMRVAQ